MEITEPGEYVLTEDLQPAAPENLTLDTDTYPRSACLAVNATGVTIDGQGHEINGTAAHANGSGQYYGVRIQNLSDSAGTDEVSALSARITNVTLTQWSRSVYSYNTHALLVNDSTIRSDLPGQTSGLYLRYSDNATIRQNVIDGPSKGVDLLEESHDANVTDNTITNTSITAIEADVDRLLVANNHVEDYGGSLDARGVYIEEGYDVRIVDNVVRDGYEGIVAYGTALQDVTISNNTLSGGDTAITLEDYYSSPNPSSANAILRNNTVDDFDDEGIVVQRLSATPTIADNVVTNVTNRGIHIFGESDNGLVESNVVTDSGTGLWFDVDQTTVQDNDLSNNDIGIDVRRSNESTVRRNDLSESGTVGAYALGLNHGTVFSNNTITDGAGTGVEITVLNDDASDVSFERNEITRNQGAGIVVDNENAPSAVGPRNPVIRANNISSNGAEGILDGDGVNATYVDNRIANNTEQGLFLAYYARNATIRNNTVVDNGGVGIQLGIGSNSETSNVTVVENQLSSNTDNAILVEESPGVVLTNNSMSDHDVDLRLTETTGVEVHDNTFETGIGFDAEDSEDYAHDVSDNAFYDGSPLYYVAGDDAPTVPQDAGQVIVVDADGLALSDLDLTTGSVPTGVLVATSNGSSVENVSVTGPARQGVRIVSLANSTVDGTMVDGSRRGIVVATSPGIDLTNATVTNVAGAESGDSDGIELTESAGATIRDSSVQNASGDGIEVGQSEGIRIESSVADETGRRGILVEQSPGAAVRTSSVLDATYSGILLDGASNSTVEGNIVTNSPSANYGLRVLNSDEVALLDNHVQGIAGEGIATTNANNVTIIDTYAYDNDVGIAVGTGDFGGEANAVLRQNELAQNDLGLDGVEIVELVNNTIRDSTNDGAFVDDSDDLTVTRNVIERNGGVGLELDVLFDVTVASNEFDDNDVAIHDAGSVGLLIDTNTFRNHDTQSVELYGTDEFTVRNNTIESTVDSDGFGISAGVRTELASGDVGTIADNAFDSNDYGIQVVAENTDLLGANLTIRDNEFTANTEGVMVYDAADEIAIANNAFTETAGDAVAYGASSPTHYLDARQNWWDAADGPSGSESDPVSGTVADGNGDAVGSNVRFDPWLGDNSSVGSNLTADVSVVGASLNTTETELNGAVTVTADVTNVGNTSGTYDADLEIDGTVEDTATVQVAPSTTETVTFTYAFTATRDYDVAVDGVTAGTVSVGGSGDGDGGDDGGESGDDGGDDGGDGEGGDGSGDGGDSSGDGDGSNGDSNGTAGGSPSEDTPDSSQQALTDNDPADPGVQVFFDEGPVEKLSFEDEALADSGTVEIETLEEPPTIVADEFGPENVVSSVEIDVPESATVSPARLTFRLSESEIGDRNTDTLQVIRVTGSVNQRLPTEVIEASGGGYRVEADTPGFSNFSIVSVEQATTPTQGTPTATEAEPSTPTTMTATPEPSPTAKPEPSPTAKPEPSPTATPARTETPVGVLGFGPGVAIVALILAVLITVRRRG
ncbi:right-handed parallel beta-helix repeat-containing protein [Haloarchaeobius sp. DFWS5]|uniref:right-handed parallel beta-helix repeat-containing protein n=1 Tax=Haloarchaeobius sp. DFWS5 TaxID=3446114 RepID=UPI003EBA9285